MAVQRSGVTQRVLTSVSPTTTVMTALPSGDPWHHCLVFSNSSPTQLFSFGDSTADASVTPWGAYSRNNGSDVWNCAGRTHVSAAQGSGSGAIFFVPCEVTMLRSPPQVDSVIVVDANAGTPTAIPDLSTGERPKYVTVSTDETSLCTIAFGDSTIVNGSTTHWSSINLYAGPVTFNVSGQTHFDWDGTTAGRKVILALLAY